MMKSSFVGTVAGELIWKTATLFSSTDAFKSAILLLQPTSWRESLLPLPKKLQQEIDFGPI